MPIRAWMPSGTYPVHPVGQPPITTDETSTITAAATSQNPRACTRGRAVRRAPIMIGTRKLPKPPSAIEDMAATMAEPWIPTRLRYWPCVQSSPLGESSCARIINALMPPNRNRATAVMRYWIPTTLLSVLSSKYRHSPRLGRSSRVGAGLEAAEPSPRVAIEAEATQPSHHAEEEAQDDRDVVLVGARDGAVVGGDHAPTQSPITTPTAARTVAVITL